MKINTPFLTPTLSLSDKKPSLWQSLKRGMKLLLLAMPLLLTACSEDASTAQASENRIKIGTSPGDFADIVREYLAPELQKSGYQVELTEITDIVIPNVSVEEGTLHLNIFQHRPYMEEFNRVRDGHLAPLVQVPTAPYGLYAGKKRSLDEIEKGATVGIPSNVTNFSRGLWILENLGWIELRDDIADPFRIEKRDITKNPYQLEIKEIEAAQMTRARDDLDYAIINGNFALDAGIHFTEALTIEPSKYFVNWVVVHEKNLNAPWATEIVKIINSDGFKAYSQERFPGYNLPLAWEEESDQ
ncbi:MetQ/NlpA family ABC transporter substrate-binding protein [Ignatzschineria sp. F8392]|uniref:MetQ/NlpA family ABC transporter substrate-binding protein n=1 Tax=Ignatzschineria sp. F8392 TaxID=1980117 RepID=UPI001E416523|nr:MetQ/NlpA family ABC transporter substrate-binding protein [Ignatzschineria sp. F8392]